MLIWINDKKEITAYNRHLTKDNSHQYINNNCLWIEGLVINPPYQQGMETLMFLNEDNTIRYEYVEINNQPEPLSNIDQAILETAVNTEYLVTLRDLTL